MKPGHLIAAVSLLALTSASQAAITGADFELKDGTNIFRNTGVVVGAGLELTAADFQGGTNTSSFASADFNPLTNILTINSNGGTFSQFAFGLENITFSNAGEEITGIHWISGPLSGVMGGGAFLSDIINGGLQSLNGGTFQLPAGATSFQIYTGIAPVPEPETWAMMLGGLGLMARRLQQRRGRQPTAA